MPNLCTSFHCTLLNNIIINRLLLWHQWSASSSSAAEPLRSLSAADWLMMHHYAWHHSQPVQSSLRMLTSCWNIIKSLKHHFTDISLIYFASSSVVYASAHRVVLLVRRMKMQRMMMDRAMHTPAMMPLMDFSSMLYRPAINAAEMVYYLIKTYWTHFSFNAVLNRSQYYCGHCSLVQCLSNELQTESTYAQSLHQVCILCMFQSEVYVKLGFIFRTAFD